MQVTILASVLVCIIGLVVHLAGSPKWTSIGLYAFAVGLLVALLRIDSVLKF